VSENESEGDLSQTLDRILAIVIRRRWLIVGIACPVALGTILILLQLPNRFTSEATIFVAHQKVPERYVAPTMPSDLKGALDAMAQEVLSHSRLLSIIDEFGLYAKEKTSVTPEELTRIMREDISIEPSQSGVNAFEISFIANSPHLAQAVTSRLTTLFIEQNLKTRTDQAISTTSFLREQLELAKNKLMEQEQRLRAYKTKYLGELPEQQQGNAAMLSGLQSQLDQLTAARNQQQQQQLYLKSLLSEYAQRDLIRLQSEKKTLLALYTLKHPAVLKKDEEIRTKQAFVDKLKVAAAAPANQEEPLDIGSDSADDIGAGQIRSQLRASRLEIDNLGKKEQRLRAEIVQYRSRLNQAPVREQQLMALQHDYDLLKDNYAALQKKEQESQLATNLEKRHEGQQFRLADPPTLPTRPSSPKRVKISLGGLAAGLGLGCALAFLVELRDSSFRAETDVTSRLAVPLLVGIPLFLTPAEQRARSRKRAFEWLAGCAIVLAVAVAELYVYSHG
jgi:succinoglycan biosynthesis transport protein ExoP